MSILYKKFESLIVKDLVKYKILPYITSEKNISLSEYLWERTKKRVLLNHLSNLKKELELANKLVNNVIYTSTYYKVHEWYSFQELYSFQCCDKLQTLYTDQGVYNFIKLLKSIELDVLKAFSKIRDFNNTFSKDTNNDKIDIGQWVKNYERIYDKIHKRCFDYYECSIINYTRWLLSFLNFSYVFQERVRKLQ